MMRAIMCIGRATHRKHGFVESGVGEKREHDTGPLAASWPVLLRTLAGSQGTVPKTHPTTTRQLSRTFHTAPLEQR